MFSKRLLLAIGLVIVMLLAMLPNVFSLEPQQMFDKHELVIETILGNGPKTLDPANCYDAASAGLLFNVYETLISFDGERYDYFIPQLADQVWIAPPHNSTPPWDPENAAPPYTNYTIYFRIQIYTFENTTSVDQTDPVLTTWKCDDGFWKNMTVFLLDWEDTNNNECLDIGDKVLMGQLFAAAKGPRLIRWYQVKDKIEGQVVKLVLNPTFHNWSRSDLIPAPQWSRYELLTEDVEHSFERLMIYDYVGGPQWMIHEPLLSCYGADLTWPADETNPINQAVQRNDTHVWLNIANKDLTHGGHVSFAPVKLFEDNSTSSWFMRQRPAFWGEVAKLNLSYPVRILFQVLSQPWCSIMSKRWLLEWVDPRAEAAGHPTGEWPQTWANWTLYHYPTLLDIYPDILPCVDILPASAAKPGVTCGTGPFILQRFNATEYSLDRYTNYWRCWPSDWPSPPYPSYSEYLGSSPPSYFRISRPKGWVDKITVIQKSTISCVNDLKEGYCDMAAVPRAWAGMLHVDGDIFGRTLPGIRLNFPIPSLVISTFHMNFNITPTSDNCYGIIYPADELNSDGIPRNFFSNMYVRKAVAHLINYTMIIQDLLLREAYQPNTFAPSSLPYVNPSVPQYYYNESLAATYFDMAYFGETKLTDVGFTLYIVTNSHNPINFNITLQLATAINKTAQDYGWNFTAFVVEQVWSQYLADMAYGMLPAFMMNWQADYVDIHSFAFPYAHSKGVLAAAQSYHNPYVDCLLEEGPYTPDGLARQAIYYGVENVFYNEVPTVPLYVAVERGYMRDWVQGMYYNPVYGASLTPLNGFSLFPVYAYPLWKWPMTNVEYTEGYFVGDVDFNGIVDMTDIMAAITAFGSYAGKAGMPVFHPRWNFHCDVDDSPRYRWRDRKIDMGDIVKIIPNFGKRSIPWHP